MVLQFVMSLLIVVLSLSVFFMLRRMRKNGFGQDKPTP